MQFIYLHGFASSPDSAKAIYLREYFATHEIPLQILDLNLGDFSHLTITRQIEQVEKAFPADGMPITLIGSSLGGLTSAHTAQKHSKVKQLVLLAPAFEFLTHWLPRLGEEKLREWQATGYLLTYHYGEKRELPLHYHFVEDARQYQETQLLQRPVPTLIFHGRHDEVIPITASRNYASDRPWVQLVEFDSDHALTDVMPQIWQAIQAFCKLG